MEDRLVAEVAEVTERRGLPSPDDVEQDALTEGVVGDDHLLDVQRLEGLVEDDRPAQDDVGPPRVEARHLEPVGGSGPTGEVVHDHCQLLGREGGPAELAHRVLTRPGPNHLGDVHDGARRPDGDLEPAGVGDHARRLHDVAAHVVPGLLDGALLDRLLGEEALAHPDGADLEAAGVEHLAAEADDELGRAAADVDDEDALVEHRNRLEDTEVDEARLLDARDHLDAHPRFLAGALEEFGAVVGLTHRARGDGVHLCIRGVGDPPEAGEGGDTAVDRLGRQLLHLARARPQPHDLLLAVEDLEAVVARRAGDDEVEAVGPQVDGGDGRSRFVRRAHPRDATGPNVRWLSL